METFIKLYDEAEDFLLTTLFRLRRCLSLLPPERRRRLRMPELTPEPASEAAR
jgi:hypothetical protein